MRWRQPVNVLLARTTGYHLARPPGHRSWMLPLPSSQRMLTAPVFILSGARSGSTLLRVILGSHSQLYAPPELPLMHLEARAETRWIQTSLRALYLTKEELDNMLWDRVLADTLARSGKPVIVVKTPSNVLAGHAPAGRARPRGSVLPGLPVGGDGTHRDTAADPDRRADPRHPVLGLRAKPVLRPGSPVCPGHDRPGRGAQLRARAVFRPVSPRARMKA